MQLDTVFNVTKGWPNHGAIDASLPKSPNESGTLTPGMIVMRDATDADGGLMKGDSGDGDPVELVKEYMMVVEGESAYNISELITVLRSNFGAVISTDLVVSPEGLVPGDALKCSTGGNTGKLAKQDDVTAYQTIATVDAVDTDAGTLELTWAQK